ncbi:MAG TPA: IS256 family transposase [Burkholderiaceae bacterium]|nr:IS256 family transposase [Burkholderiaceae bacterium]
MTIKKKQKDESAFDYAAFEKEAIAGLTAGKGLIGENGVLTGLVGRLLKAAYEGEMDAHLEDPSTGCNRRNGYTEKTIRTSLGPVGVRPPRDRQGTFEPELIRKWDRSLAPELEQQVLHLYGIGNSYEDIQAHLKRMYGVNYSPSFLSHITDRVYEEIEQWRNRPLEERYFAIYLDAIHYKVRENRKVVTKAVYSVYGVAMDGERDVLGLFIGEAEGARHWARVLEHIRDRGVKDVFFFCVDGLGGFSEAIEGIFPAAITQRCIVHMVRTSLKFVSYRDYKEVCQGLRAIYTQDTAEAALEKLAEFKQCWQGKYPEIAAKWEKSWAELSPFFDQPEAVRRVIYTTNPVEALHRVLRKATKTKGAFISESALEKQLYLTLVHNQKSWKTKVRGWPDILRALRNHFPERFKNDGN